jgi:hypothetical protein
VTTQADGQNVVMGRLTTRGVTTTESLPAEVVLEGQVVHSRAQNEMILHIALVASP